MNLLDLTVEKQLGQLEVVRLINNKLQPRANGYGKISPCPTVNVEYSPRRQQFGNSGCSELNTY